ncbi:hypothetical protein [Microbacterium sp. GXF0217]
MTDTSIAPRTTLVPGAGILLRLRRLIVVSILAALASWFFISGSKGWCPGGLDADGGYLDAAGQPTPEQPMCASLTLQPSGFMPIVLTLAVIWVIGRVVRSAADEAGAIRMIDRVAAVIAIVTAAGILISYVWFALTPLPDPGASYAVFSPFPFASIDVDISPMTP